MLFAEPPPSPYDVHFSIVRIPVRVHPFFWLVGVFLGYSAGRLLNVLIWVAALFVAILVHELGHALMMRYFGLRPWITLHGMGGATGYDTGQLAYSRANTWIRQILILLAGVGTELLLVLVMLAACIALGCTFVMFAGMGTGLAVELGVKSPCFVGIVHGIPVAGFDASLEGISSSALSQFLNALLFICLIWSLVNLLPVYPLDGGQIAREVFLRFNVREGVRYSLILSMLTAGTLAALALARMLHNARVISEAGGSPGSAFRSVSLFIAFFFGYLAYSSFATLRAYGGGRGRW